MKKNIFKLVLTSLLFWLCSMASAQSNTGGRIRGVVVTDDGTPAPGVTIKLEGVANKAVVTSDDGRFLIGNLPEGDYKITATYIGYNSAEETVTVTWGKTTEVRLALSLTQQGLEEVFIESNRILNKSAATANKMPLTPIESPQVVHSISDVILRKQNAMTLEDAMKNAPGVTKLWDATSRPDGGSIFTSRGFQVLGSVRNGLPNILNTNVDMANLDRIEIIKGPSATLFGSVVSSYGGIINRVTKKPFFRNEGYADFSFGNYGFFRASGDANFVLKENEVAARINIATQNQTTWQDRGFQKSYMIAPSLVYKPSEKLTFNFDAEIVGTKGNSNGGNFMFVATPSQINGALYQALVGAGLPDQSAAAIVAQAPQTFKEAFGTDKVEDLKLDYNKSFLSNDLYTSTQSNSFFANSDYQISNHWKSQTAVTYGQSKNEGFSAFQYLIPNYLTSFMNSISAGGAPEFGTPGVDTIARAVWNPIGNTNTFNVQQNFVSDYQFGNFRNRAVIGLDYVSYQSFVTYNRFIGSLAGVPYPDVFDMTSADGSSPNYNDFTAPKVHNVFGSGATSILQYNSDSKIYSAYINDVINITDYVIVNAGVRVDHFIDNLALTDETKKQTKLSPKFGLIFMPIKDQLSIFANYQNSFTNQFGTDASGQRFDPEEANQKEAGIKYSLFNNRITGSVSYYDILVKNIVRTDPQNLNFSIQDGEQKSKGVDAEILANPVTGWIVLFGYGYNDSKLLKAEKDVNGLRPVGSGPRSTYNFWTNYTFTQKALNGLGIGVSLNHASETYAFNQMPDGKLIMPAYTILGSHLTYDTKRLRLGIKVNNITNQRYWMGWSSIIPQMPRQAIGSIAVKF